MAASTSTFRAWANPGRRGSCRVEVEAAILASKRLRSRSGCFDFDFRAWCCMSGIIIPDMRMSGIIIPDMQHQARKSKSKQPLRLRSRFEARMAASTSTLQLPLLPGLAQALKVEVEAAILTSKWLRSQSKSTLSGLGQALKVEVEAAILASKWLRSQSNSNIRG